MIKDARNHKKITITKKEIIESFVPTYQHEDYMSIVYKMYPKLKTINNNNLLLYLMDKEINMTDLHS